MTYQRLPRRRQQAVAWIYIPVAQRDAVVALGSRVPSSEATFSSGTCLLFRMQLGGDVSVGVGLSEEFRDVLLSKSPTTIIYNELELQPVSVFGAYPTEVRKDSRPATPFSQPLIEQPQFPYAYFSLAPLERVDRIRIFNDELSGFCVGILFGYQNGAQRSVGQCRIGNDPFKDCAKPSRICLHRHNYGRSGTPARLQATMVKSTSGQKHDHDEQQDWTCFQMQGRLDFWFSFKETSLAVILD
ncbi:Ff.00g040990.m01.CDS01 [Fusarium sp. VM40]|nr:Ff.00g040990.m01.CDS01 [Fusarium sp. VM40]